VSQKKEETCVFHALYSTGGSSGILLTAFHPLQWALTKTNKPNVCLY